MQLQPKNRTELSRTRAERRRLSLLLVGSENVFNDASSEQLFHTSHFNVVARSSSLLEAIACLDSKGIDIVLLSQEFCPEELRLFNFDARRRGFPGLIWQSAEATQTTPVGEVQVSSTIQTGDFFIETSSQRVWLRGDEIHCRPMEFELLKFLSLHSEELLSYQVLLRSLWGDAAASSDSLRGLIRAVRLKIETTPEPRYIVTHRQFGYRFNPSPAPYPRSEDAKSSDDPI